MTDCIIVIGLPTRFKCGSTIDIPHVIKLRPSIPVLIGSVVCHFGFYLSAACPSFPLVSRSSSGGFRCYCNLFKVSTVTFLLRLISNSQEENNERSSALGFKRTIFLKR